MASKEFKVSGISCGHCANTIKRELVDIQGVSSVDINVEAKTVNVEWKEETTDWPAIHSLLQEINYPPDE